MTILCGSDSTPVAALWARATREELVVQKQLALDARASLVVLDGFDSTTDSVAQACRAPLLVVRAPQALEQWLSGKSELKVAVAYDPSPTGDAALAWAAGLARLAPVALVAMHSYGIHEQRAKRGVSGPLPIGASDARIETPLEDELRAHIAGLALGCELQLVLRGCLGRPAEHLVQIAAEMNAGLLVVGNHHRRGLERAWKGSVSRGVIELSKCNVACISVREPA